MFNDTKYKKSLQMFATVLVREHFFWLFFSYITKYKLNRKIKRQKEAVFFTRNTLSLLKLWKL